MRKKVQLFIISILCFCFVFSSLSFAGVSIHKDGKRLSDYDIIQANHDYIFNGDGFFVSPLTGEAIMMTEAKFSSLHPTKVYIPERSKYYKTIDSYITFGDEVRVYFTGIYLLGHHYCIRYFGERYYKDNLTMVLECYEDLFTGDTLFQREHSFLVGS